MPDIKYVLASKSPRRAELMRYITPDFEILPADCEETLPDGIDPFEAPEFLAVQKALNVVKKRPDSLVIGCDTVVILDNEIMGKPHDMDEAYWMLRSLSGRVHTVVSGVCICFKGRTLSFTQKTAVEFYPLSDEDITGYIRESSPLDKAGSYGIQDKGGLFVKSISGDHYNVIGLPLARLNQELKKIIRLFG